MTRIHKRYRLLRNRVSAQQARERKKAYLQNLEEKMAKLEERSVQLQVRSHTETHIHSTESIYVYVYTPHQNRISVCVKDEEDMRESRGIGMGTHMHARGR